MSYRNKKIQQKRTKKLYWVIALALLGVIALITVLELTDITTLFHKKAYTPHTSNQYTKGEGNQSSQSNQPNVNTNNNPGEGDDTSKDTKGQSDTPVAPETTLIQPTGNFVSTHRFSLVSNPPIGSTCETTPKATCQVIFTNGGKTIELTPQTTDDGGAAYWTWSPKDIGLTIGTWKIRAKAQLGSQAKTADDALNLEVTP